MCRLRFFSNRMGMNIVVSGSTGLVGQALTQALASAGHTVVRLVRRRPTEEGTSLWNPATGALDRDVIECCDAVVNLSGASIAGGPWTRARKSLIRASRLTTTGLLVRTIGECQRGPSVLISASAVGYYGDRGNEILTEDSAPGSGFLSETCVAWEAAAYQAHRSGVRVVCLRTGLVMSSSGGFLRMLVLPFKLGGGAVLGDGTQMMSWISLDDLVRAYLFALEHNELSGPINVVTPHAVSNREFTAQLAAAVHRPAFLRLPSAVLVLALRDMARELLLSGQHVRPKVLGEAGFSFTDPELGPTLGRLLY